MDPTKFLTAIFNVDHHNAHIELKQLIQDENNLSAQYTIRYVPNPTVVEFLLSQNLKYWAQQALIFGADPTIMNINGASPLHFACANPEHWDMIPYLIRYSKMVMQCNFDGRSALEILYEADVEENPLFLAGKDGIIDSLLQFIVAQGVNITDTAEYSTRKTALIIATEYGTHEQMQYLLQNNANPNLPDIYNNYPLHYACTTEDHYNKILLLLNARASSSLRNSQGDLSLHLLLTCAEHTNISQETIVRLAYLLDPEDINIPNNKGQTVLHLICRYNVHAVIQELVDIGANIEARDNEGKTCLQYAFKIDYKGQYNLDESITTIECLLRYDPDIFTCDNNGNNILHNLCLYRPAPELINFALELDIMPDTLNNDGETAFHLACYAADTQVIPLIANYSNIHLLSARNQNILHYLCKYEETFGELIPKNPNTIAALLNILEEKGCNLTIMLSQQDIEGNTPLHCAALHEEFITLFERIFGNEIYSNEVINYFLQIQNYNQKTIRDIARDSNCNDILELLTAENLGPDGDNREPLGDDSGVEQ